MAAFPNRRGWIVSLAVAGTLAAGLNVAAAFAAGTEGLQIVDAWVPPAEETGIDLPFGMTIKNAAANPDALLRVRCPVANFAEKHIVDRGEGAPAMRAIPSIPIPANAAITLKRDGYHVMLLQTRQKLIEGDAFTCSIVFQKAGTIETEVRITSQPR